MASGSKLAVGAAIGGNAVVCAAKFTAFFITGSGAMLSEGIHSFADTLNQILLMVGIVRSDRKADTKFRYGYLAERYVWALISAVGIFFLGCGVTVYHGVHSFLNPHPIDSPGTALAVLVFALVVEGVVLVIAYRSLLKAAGGKPFIAYIRYEADPSAVAVLLEDAAACLGVVIAMACIGLALVTGEPRWDAVGSISIGLLLGAMAIWLIARNQKILLGPAIPKVERDAILRILERSPIIEEVVDLKTRMLGTENYRIKANVVFEGSILSTELDSGLRDAWDQLDTYEQFRDFCHRYADQVTDLLGDRIDTLETEIRAAVPRVKHIDIEAD